MVDSQEALQKKLTLSHSSLQKYKTCPNQFHLYKYLGYKEDSVGVHTSFGSAIGAGCAEFVRTRSLSKAYLAAFAAWETVFSDTLKNKSFPTVLDAIDQFSVIFSSSYSQYTHVASELKISIDLSPLFPVGGAEGPASFPYQEVEYVGYVDLIVADEDGEQQIWEFKTESGWTIEPYSYEVSPQALWYSLATRAKYNTSRTVVYPVVTAARKLPEWAIFKFNKTIDDERDALNQLEIFCKSLILYTEIGFLKNESSCFKYNRECFVRAQCKNPDVIYTAPAARPSTSYRNNWAETKLSLTDLKSMLY